MRSLYLIGFRGAGKTTFGSMLAQRKRMRFLDLDESFENKTGKKILDFVEENGLIEFRKLECEILREVDITLRHGAPATVVATGGGIVEWEESCRILSQSPCARVYLELSAAELWERLQHSPERKKIGDLNGLEALETLLEKRRASYEKIATFRLWNRDISVALDALEHQWDSLWPGGTARS